MNYIEEIEKLKEKKHEEGKYSIFDTEFSNKLLEQNMDQQTFDILVEWNEKCSISKEIGDYLNKLVNDQNNTVAFHKKNISDIKVEDGNIKSDTLIDAATNGLINSEHSGSGLRLKDPSNALYPLGGLDGFINFISTYKSNNAVLIYSFPSEYIDDNLLFCNVHGIGEIYDFDDGFSKIRPEHLVGAIIKEGINKDTFITKDEIIESNTKTL